MKRTGFLHIKSPPWKKGWQKQTASFCRQWVWIGTMAFAISFHWLWCQVITYGRADAPTWLWTTEKRQSKFHPESPEHCPLLIRLNVSFLFFDSIVPGCGITKILLNKRIGVYMYAFNRKSWETRGSYRKICRLRLKKDKQSQIIFYPHIRLGFFYLRWLLKPSMIYQQILIVI